MKNIFAWIVTGIGSMSVVIGMMVGVPLMLFVVNNLFYKGNNAKDIVPLYINNSLQIQVSVPDYLPDDPASQFWYKNTTYRSPLKKDGKRNLLKMTFYSTELKKYVEIILFDLPGGLMFTLLGNVHGKKIWITVNKDDLNNSRYGSKDNPIPVFSFLTDRELDEYDHYEVSKDRYYYNVTQYLTYIMSKEEFENKYIKK